jgi:hypothetical protein
MFRIFIVVLVLVVTGSVVAEETPAERCGSLCHEKACENYEFHGFSPDSDQYGYSHLTCPGKLGGGSPRFTYHVRRIKPGKRKRRTEGVSLEGVSYPGYYDLNDYWVEGLPAEKVGKQKYEFRNDRGLEITVELVTEKKVAWYFTLKGREGLRYSYRGEFEEIYFGLQPKVYLSPNGQRAAVVLLLDAMVKVDAALVIFSLNP